MKLTIGGEDFGSKMGNDQLHYDDFLPDFTLTNADGQTLTTKDLEGQLTLLSVVPSLDTDVCSLETAHFNQVASDFKGIKFITVSNDPVASQKNWCAAHDADGMEILSDANGSFGKAMHLYIPGFDHLARVVYIVDASGKIVYEQMVHEVSHEPNYDLIIKELEKLTNK
ncbi:2-Cys peroxiredoxin [Fructilactobacillus sanfranciscensis]|uniref:thiol peroxidase n=1 Tax=Fructilactobacillus sanfranciscensis TaxID=1625 RepID=UPI000CD3E86C|nr:peroxiredoxin [Fructilactobacillus sanfranciscensis]POH13762.1 2-Cys peroxiredoxin [Fructilactobacillus sanfranciscensis]